MSDHRGPIATFATAVQSQRDQSAAAHWIQNRGVRAGDRIVMEGAQTTEFVACVLGALRSGIIPVVIKAGLTQAETDFQISDAKPRLVMDPAAQRAAVGAGGSVELASVPLARPMLYTSGTTGKPKAVWSGVLDEDAASKLSGEEADMWGHGPTDTHLVVAPLTHSAPLRFAMSTLVAGGSIAIARDRAAVPAALKALRPTTLFMAPAHLQRLQAQLSRVDLSSIRLVAHAGSPCPEPLKRWAIEVFPSGAVWEFYGATEGQFTACSPAEWMDRPGTVGRARPGRTLRVDNDGVVWCRTPTYARFEYWEDRRATEAAWDGDSFTVSDLGTLDDDGYLFLRGRRDDLIISGGVNVYPLEIESALLSNERVQDVAVVGVPDDHWGERVTAIVVTDLDSDELTTWLAERLAPWKLPKAYVHADAIATGPSGKRNRAALTELVANPTSADRAKTSNPATTKYSRATPRSTDDQHPGH